MDLSPAKTPLTLTLTKMFLIRRQKIQLKGGQLDMLHQMYQLGASKQEERNPPNRQPRKEKRVGQSNLRHKLRMHQLPQHQPKQMQQTPNLLVQLQLQLQLQLQVYHQLSWRMQWGW